MSILPESQGECEKHSRDGLIGEFDLKKINKESIIITHDPGFSSSKPLGLSLSHSKSYLDENTSSNKNALFQIKITTILLGGIGVVLFCIACLTIYSITSFINMKDNIVSNDDIIGKTISKILRGSLQRHSRGYTGVSTLLLHLQLWYDIFSNEERLTEVTGKELSEALTRNLIKNLFINYYGRTTLFFQADRGSMMVEVLRNNVSDNPDDFSIAGICSGVALPMFVPIRKVKILVGCDDSKSNIPLDEVIRKNALGSIELENSPSSYRFKWDSLFLVNGILAARPLVQLSTFGSSMLSSYTIVYSFPTFISNTDNSDNFEFCLYSLEATASWSENWSEFTSGVDLQSGLFTYTYYLYDKIYRLAATNDKNVHHIYNNCRTNSVIDKNLLVSPDLCTEMPITQMTHLHPFLNFVLENINSHGGNEGVKFYRQSYKKESYIISKEGAILEWAGSDASLYLILFISTESATLSLYWLFSIICLVLVLVLFSSLLFIFIVYPIRLASDKMIAMSNMDLSLVNNRTSASIFKEISDVILLNERMNVVLDSFVRYVPHTVVKEIIASGGSHSSVQRLSSHFITVIFIGINRFSSIRRHIPSTSVLVQLLESYLTRITTSLLRHGCTIDKFMGDVVMGFWGAPLTYDRQGFSCCATALHLFHEAEQLEESFKSHSFHFSLQIGAHSGFASVGNVGCKARITYTALGDTVNTASRVHGLTKHLDIPICITSNVLKDRNTNLFSVRRLGLFRLKGKDEVREIYQILGAKDKSKYDSVSFNKDDRIFCESNGFYPNSAWGELQAAYKGSVNADGSSLFLASLSNSEKMGRLNAGSTPNARNLFQNLPSNSGQNSELVSISSLSDLLTGPNFFQLSNSLSSSNLTDLLRKDTYSPQEELSKAREWRCVDDELQKVVDSLNSIQIEWETGKYADVISRLMNLSNSHTDDLEKIGISKGILQNWIREREKVYKENPNSTDRIINMKNK